MKHEWIGNSKTGFILSVPIVIDNEERSLTTRVGKIKRRGENRYQWVALPSKWRPDWVKEVKQGIAGSVDEAKAKILACKPTITIDIENIGQGIVVLEETASDPAVIERLKEWRIVALKFGISILGTILIFGMIPMKVCLWRSHET